MTTTPLDEVDDRILLRRHVAGDREAFGEVYRRHRDRMWAVAVGVCGDRELAAEAVQEGFVSAFRRADSFRGDAQVTTWLHRIVVNASIDQIRKARPTAELTDEVVSRAPAAPDSASRVDTRLAVHEALHSLPEGQRLALVLVDMHGLPVAEAAQVLDVAVGREALAAALVAAGFTDEGTSGAADTSDTPGHTDSKGGGHD